MKAFVQTSPFERAALWLLPSTRDRALDWLAAAIDSDDGLDADDEFVRAIASQIGPNSALLFYHALRRRCLCPVAIWRPSFVAAFAAGEEVLPKAEPEPEFETLLEAIVDGDDASVDSFLLEFASGGLSREQLEFCEVTPLELARELGRDRIVGELQAFLDGGDPHGALDESLLKRRARQGDPCAQFELGWRRWDTDGAA